MHVIVHDFTTSEMTEIIKFTNLLSIQLTMDSTL